MKHFAILFILFLTVQSVFALPPLGERNQTPAGAVYTQDIQNIPVITPLKKWITKWSIKINREIPKRMRKLKNEPTMAVVMASALAAFLYGIFHTLGPGHGKMVVATYFLSNGANMGRGIWVGLQVALSHVGGAIALVLFTDIALRNLLTSPEQQVYWVKLISYGFIIAIGSFMAYQAMQKILHKHENVHTCGHCAKHNHSHKHKKKETLLSWSLGAVPCTGSLLILVYAMAYDVLWLGLFMVISIAIGMAVTMIAIGVICISGKQRIIDHFTENHDKSHVMKGSIELVGSFAIMLIGGILFYSLYTF